MIRLLVVDDHAVVREGVKRILAEVTDIVVTGEAEQAQEMYDALAIQDFDIILLDISLPGSNGLDLLKYVRTRYPDVLVLIFSIHPERQYVVRALREGAAGYLLKNSVPKELIIAIQKIAQGERYISAALTTHLMHEIAKTAPAAQAPLTVRESQVLRLLATGHAMKEIAYTLGVSIKTVSTYRSRMLEKLGLHTTADLIRYALRHGLVE